MIQKNKLLNVYFSIPMFLDFLFFGVVTLVIHFNECFFISHFNINNSETILSNLISGQISLVGFILAALTIIVTLKSNIKSKGLDEATNALELIFSSKHYKSIVDVFKKSIIELAISFVLMYLIWGFVSLEHPKYVILLIFFGIITTSLPLFRCLLILFRIMNMEHKTKQ